MMVIKFFQPFRIVSIAPLIIFRMIFGAMLVFGGIRFLMKGWVSQMYIEPDFFFGYLGLEWVKPFPGLWMYLPLFIFILSALGIFLGAFYRYSSLLLFLSFSYIELLDKSNYLNHYYFINLITFLLLFVPANRSFSIDVAYRRVKELTHIPAWNIGIFKFQLSCVYVFAGIAKLESDWLLNAQPLQIWLQAHRDMPIFGTLLTKKWIAYFFSWFGCIYDLTIVFFLLWKKSRWVAYIFVIVFHFVTWYLLPIGIFPWVMIFSTLIFFSTEFHEVILNRFRSVFRSKNQLEPNRIYTDFKSTKLISILIGIYIFIQVIVPFRYVLYPGDLFWNEEGFRFSWRVMLMHKEAMATFYIRDRKTGREIEIKNSDFLCPTQIDQMATQPDMILQYAKYLNKKFSDTLLMYSNQSVKLNNPSVHAEIYVSLNGRPSQLFVSKKHDLTKFTYNLKHRNWLEEYKK